MNSFLAIVLDTWRQSKQQTVFVVMLVILLVLSIGAVALPKFTVDEDGTRQFGILFSDGPTDSLANEWIETYATSLLAEKSEGLALFSGDAKEREKLERAREAAREEAAAIPPFQRSVEFWLHLTAGALFSFSMLLFIGACASYFPDLLTAGSLDVVLAKPVSRLQVFLGKYLGGLALFSMATVVCYTVVAVGIGLRSGIWHGKLFLALPLHLFAAALLYAILAALGVLRRSTGLAILVGYFFYVVVDSVLGQAIRAQKMGALDSIGWLDRTVSVLRKVLPNFTELKQLSVTSVLNIPAFEWTPLLVAAAWLAVMLGVGYGWFRRSDY